MSFTYEYLAVSLRRSRFYPVLVLGSPEGWVACLALFRTVGSSAMLNIIGSSRYVARYGLLRPEALDLRWKQREVHSWIGRSRRLHILPWEPAQPCHLRKQQQQQQQAFVGCLPTMPTSVARVHNPRWTCKAGRHHFPTMMNPKGSQPAGGQLPTGAGASTSVGASSFANHAGVAAGTRVRLRDTGRLGTVIGQKKGGWWVVDVLETWDPGATPDSNMSTSSLGDRAGDSASAATAARGESGANRNISAVSKPISTRRVNMEPLGDAYSSPEPLFEISSPAAGGEGHQGISGTEKSGTKPRGRTKVGGSRKSKADVAAADSVDTIAAPVLGGGTLPSLLPGQTISLAQTHTLATREEREIVIHAMSANETAHGEMKEWIIFSDLHVSPSSLAVSLEVGERY